MNKALKFKTIQTPEKEEFDRLLNINLDIGWSLVDGGYQIIDKKGKNTVYSQALYLSDEYSVDEINGKIKQISKVNKKGKPDGRFTRFHDNGEIAEIGSTPYSLHENWGSDNTVGGLPCNMDGLYFYYNERGDLLVKGSYKNGFRNGDWEEYYSDPNVLKRKGYYDEGCEKRLWEEYYDNGQIERRASYYGIKCRPQERTEHNFNLVNGHYQSWFPNGQLYREFFAELLPRGDSENFLVYKIKDEKQYDEDGYQRYYAEAKFDNIKEYNFDEKSSIKYYTDFSWFSGKVIKYRDEYLYCHGAIIEEIRESGYGGVKLLTRKYKENTIPEWPNKLRSKDHTLVEEKKIYNDNIETLVEYLNEDEVRISMKTFYNSNRIKQEKSLFADKKDYSGAQSRIFWSNQSASIDLPRDYFLKISPNDDDVSEKNYDEEGNLISEKRGNKRINNY